MEPAERPTNFILDAVAADLQGGRFNYVRTRLPPEPNGYLHIGHVKAFFIDYNTAKAFGGELYLRFDDTNPAKEETEFVDAIKDDITWLGIHWDRETYASDYFDLLYDWALRLVKMGLAYVDDQSAEEMSLSRGTLHKARWGQSEMALKDGTASPYRDRSIEENLDLLERMKNGEFPEGSRVLRARIDMSHPNILMRDPVLYRIMRTPHHRTGTKWNIYPMYDWSHGQNDSMEGITHSLCSFEYEIHRPLYEWFLEKLDAFRSRQIEFSRLNLTYAMMSKRKLRKLVETGMVRGWDDPRLTTLRGLRRRGATPAAIIDFNNRIGVSKTNSWVDMGLLEACIREGYLNKTSQRRMAVLKPLRLIIDNYPADQVEWMEAVNNPENPADGTRKVPFARELFIEQEDFRPEPPPKYFRLFPGNEVRLRYAYLVTCTSFERDPASGEITTVHCTYDPATRGGDAPDGRKVKSTIHWVSAQHAARAEMRLYSQLFSVERPDDAGDVDSILNPNSLEVLTTCFVEPTLADVQPGAKYQFERTGYFCADPDSAPGAPVFNRTVTLKDSWAKVEKKQQ